MSEENKIMENATTQTSAPDAMTIAPDLQAKLAQYGADTATMTKIMDLGVESLDDLAVLKDSDLVQAGMKLAKARKLLAEFVATDNTAARPATRAADMRGMAIPSYDDILQKVPGNETWFSRLKTDGILKVDDSSYIAAIRAAMADQVGLYDVPAALVREMDAYADTAEEQVGPEYFELRDILTRRSYADLFAAVKGLNGSYITDKRRRDFLVKMQKLLWPALIRGQEALDGWYQIYRSEANDFANIALALQGQGDMASAPDTSPLHDAGDAIITAINRSFSGIGVQVAAALAYDACEVLKALDNPRLPMLIGVNNRELMLNKINIKVSSSYERQERNLVQFVLSFVKHDTITADAEARYFKALWQLGSQIEWSQLGAAGTKMPGKNRTATATMQDIAGRPSQVEL